MKCRCRDLQTIQEMYPVSEQYVILHMHVFELYAVYIILYPGLFGPFLLFSPHHVVLLSGLLYGLRREENY